MLPGLGPWQSFPAYGTGTIGGTGSSVGQERQELPRTLEPPVDNDVFARPPAERFVPVRFAGSFANGRLPPIQSFDDFVPEKKRGNGDDRSGW
jgi:hypothetical protein